MQSLGKMHSRAKSRSCDNYLSIKDTESLDSCIQSTLSSLYRPFSATASTVLWQLFSVVERQYRGDGLRCFIDFLLPAKSILQIIQQETCLRFRGLLLYNEGWPLCIHDKVVLQLSPLHKVRLKQGDFYLQIVPLGRKSAKLVIKCLSASGQAIVEIPIAESMYGSVFTAEFLQNVTLERNLHPLQNCLLTTGKSVYRTPWKNVVSPLFVSSTAEAIMQAQCSRVSFRGQLSACGTSGSTGTLDSHRSSRESLHSQGADSTFSEPASPPNRNRTDTSSESHSMSKVDITTPIIKISPTEERGTERRGEDTGGRERGPASKMLSFSTDLSNPGPRRRHPRDSVAFESRRLFRKSYMEALQNPMSLGSSTESILEENPDHGGLREGSVTPGSSPDTRTSREHLARRLGSRGWLTGDESRPSTPLHYLQKGLRSAERRAERRSKSLERTNKAGQGKAHRERSSSGGSASISPKKLMNGYVLRFGKLEVEATLPGCERRSSKEVPGQQEDTGDDRKSRLVEEESNSPKPANGSAVGLGSSTSSSNDRNVSLPKRMSEVNQELLASGAVILPGSRDRSGRPVLQVCARAQVWAGESCTVHDLSSLLIYFHSTLRKDKRDEGLTVVIDSRRQQPVPALLSSLSEFQTLVPNALYSVLFLVDKEAAAKPERDIVNVQTETLSSLKALLKHVEQNQLTRDLEGTFHYDHSHWMHFRQKIEPFASSCSQAIASLQESIATLSVNGNLKTSEEVSRMMEQQKHLMKCVLEDSHLNRLRLEGGTILARIRKEEACDNESYRDAVDMLSALYNQVDEEVHELVILSNKSQKDLERLLEVRRFEERTQQVKMWFSVEGDKHLTPLESLTLSVSNIKAMKESLDQFLKESVHQQRHALQMVKESPQSLPASVSSEFKQHIVSILSRVEKRKANLDILANLYEFYDSVNQWREHCQDYVSHVNTSDEALSSAVVQILQDYCTEASKFSMENFSTLNDMVLSLECPQQVQQWNAVWHRCQQTKQQLEDTLARATRASSDSISSELPDVLKPTEIQISVSDNSECGLLAEGSSCPSRTTMPLTVEDTKPHSDEPFSKSPSGSIVSSSRFTFPPDSKMSPSMFDDTDSDCTIDSTISCHSEPIFSAASRVRKSPMKKIMKKTMSYELTPRDSSHTDTSHVHGYTGVYIKGLEVANNVSAEKKLQRPDLMSPALGRSRSMSTPSRMHNRHSEGDVKKQSSKMQHIMDEMISTEREYVRSLSYVIEHYFPEMERLDLPQDLRGKRSIIFGNVEKLWDFHSQYFLKDLESCAHSPLSISSCFLRHEDQFGMYALYSKNKPQSDSLLSSHGNEFFKNKQLDLGDKMDLASYLLKPIQRMSKYALLLKDLIKECGQSQAQELSDLRTAEEMVKFQLRHGNDLLAMDAIRGCDVNLKEQGQLRCQDEFIVWCGRRKYLRHVFLFEDLILFSKTKKIEGGYDIYIYKQSYKTAEIGMTENVGDSGLRFEIWFRRRKSQDTFILQASSVEIKAVWTSIIGKILWRQALRNRELRMKEMVSMGIGSKPFMDIKPSDAAINDRAIDYIMKGSECRTRASIAVPSYEYSASIKRPHSTISNSSTSSSSSQSSSSLLGSLNLHLYSSPSHPHAHPYPLATVPSFTQWPYDCIEEDELEHDCGSQPSMLTESSETSSQCTSNDSVTGLSTLTLPGPADGLLDSYNNNNNNNEESSSFLCSSVPPSSTQASLFSKSEELHPQGNKFITASQTSHIAVGLSTVV
ncbi:pleckstrin homology domain-containing family G member 4B isoform X1 [Hippocampus comes]|uniref:pleckstrin homology domain-containing family G member 4B isoform X1 n=1 Tax=Hippocampus comes TaxID=109280 RepID=UPI00094F0E8B|nr:PREDICTED: pleckstrin homology domain-containing family G member 4B isoform X1 [Hippocampus comes]XP_019729184.1 PREDICTED: pleckstrin homology domain-containing family G member 4B isoform X1 [Hippocampus comes]